MSTALQIILIHQLIFQGMFVGKNLYLSRKLGREIRGNNPEALLAIAYFALFIAFSLYLAAGATVAPVTLLPALILMGSSLLMAAAALFGLGDSWRVGVIEDQSTVLVDKGVYRYTRNPYFVAYLLMLTAYTLLLQSRTLLILSLAGALVVHRMVLTEEHYLEATHGDRYRQYRARVPRYLLFL